MINRKIMLSTICRNMFSLTSNKSYRSLSNEYPGEWMNEYNEAILKKDKAFDERMFKYRFQMICRKIQDVQQWYIKNLINTFIQNTIEYQYNKISDSIMKDEINDLKISILNDEIEEIENYIGKIHKEISDREEEKELIYGEVSKYFSDNNFNFDETDVEYIVYNELSFEDEVGRYSDVVPSVVNTFDSSTTGSPLLVGFSGNMK